MVWLIENLGGVIAFVVFALMVRGVLKTLRQAAEKDRSGPRPSRVELDPDASERTRRVQEEIRRKIAERRAAGRAPLPQPSASPSPLQRIPPLVRPMGVPPVDTFGGPSQPAPQPSFSDAEAATTKARLAREELASREAATAAIMERQRQLQEQMRNLEAKRRAEQKRAGEIATTQQAGRVAAAQSAPVGRQELLTELRDVHALRRTIILREVLGAPVALR